MSFDIDGTLEVGYPPGPVPIAVVRAARQRFSCPRYVHVGDTVQDELEARRAGFEFVRMDEVDGALFGSEVSG